MLLLFSLNDMQAGVQTCFSLVVKKARINSGDGVVAEEDRLGVVSYS